MMQDKEKLIQDIIKAKVVLWYGNIVGLLALILSITSKVEMPIGSQFMLFCAGICALHSTVIWLVLRDMKKELKRIEI